MNCTNVKELGKDRRYHHIPQPHPDRPVHLLHAGALQPAPRGDRPQPDPDPRTARVPAHPSGATPAQPLPGAARPVPCRHVAAAAPVARRHAPSQDAAACVPRGPALCIAPGTADRRDAAPRDPGDPPGTAAASSGTSSTTSRKSAHSSPPPRRPAGSCACSRRMLGGKPASWPALPRRPRVRKPRAAGGAKAARRIEARPPRAWPISSRPECRDGSFRHLARPTASATAACPGRAAARLSGRFEKRLIGG